MTHGDEQRSRDTLVERLRLLGEIESTQTAHFHQTAATKYGLNATDMKALSTLLQDGPQTAGALSERLGITSGAVTGVLDRLQHRGFITRAPDPSDRRRVIATAELAALGAGENAYVPIGDAFDALYASYTTTELRFLAQHLERAIEITRDATAALTRAD